MIQHLLEGERSRPLPAGQQAQMAAAYRQTKDPALERRLIESNLRLVVKIARELDRTRGRCLEDLVQEGCLGLIQAIRRFDPEKGASLTTYAAFWIRAFVIKHTMENVRVVRAVRTRADRVAFFRGVVGSAEVSLETAAGPDVRPIGEVLADPAPPADQVLERAQLALVVQRSAAALERRLGGRDVTILRERLLATEPTPRQVVAKKVSLTGERVRQIEGTLQAAIRTGIGDDQLAAAA
jgi:RNA polymerase sigma-32 factor